MLARKIQTSSKLSALISTLAFLTLGSAFTNPACAQAIAEAAGATSVSAAAASSVKPVTMPKLPVSVTGVGASSPHLVASSGPAPEDTNRQALEAHAGKDAGKLLLACDSGGGSDLGGG